MTADKTFNYRVKIKTGQGVVGEFIADVPAPLDETARRRIVGRELKDGNQVLKIVPAGDGKRQPGDWSTRSYKD